MVLLHLSQEQNENNGAFSPEQAVPVHGNDNAAQAIAPIGSVYKLNAFRMAEMGYHPLPVGSGTKYPCIGRWQRYCRATPSTGDIEQYSRIPNAGISLAMGSPIGAHIVIAIDVDVEDGRLDLITDSLPFSPMEKVGRKGFTRFYRADPAVVTRRYDDETGTRLVDLLSRSVRSNGDPSGSQCVMPPSIHPDTGLAYRWIKGPVPAADLPIFDADAMARLEDTLAHFGWDGRQMPRETEDTPQQPSVSRDEDGSFGRELNDLAMANFEAWVPDLCLYGVRRKAGGFEAVPSFRASGSGRALEQRGRKLSFIATGIQDFGTGNGYTPIDVTMAALGLSNVEAIYWLKERLVTPVDTSDLDGLKVLYYTKQDNEAAEATLPRDPLADEIVPAVAVTARSNLVWDDADANVALETKWLIKKLLPDRGVALLYGASGSSKSFVTLEMTACVITGHPFFGLKTKLPGGVLFALGEAAGTMPNRMNGLRNWRIGGMTQDESFRGLDLKKLPVTWLPVGNLIQPAPMAAFKAEIRAAAAGMLERHACPLRLIFVDTAVASFGFADDPDATSVQSMMKQLATIAQEMNVCFVVVHHAGKSKEAGAHGSYNWTGSVDSAIFVDGKKDATLGTWTERRLILQKEKNGGNEGWNASFELKSVVLGTDEDEEDVTSAIVVPFEPEAEVVMTSGGTPAVGARRVLDALGAASKQAETIATEDGRQVEAIRRVDVRAVYAPNHPGKPDTVDRNFSRDLDRAIDLGLVEKGTARNAVWLWLLASNDNGIAAKYASDA